MTKEIHFDARAVRPVTGGIVVGFDGGSVPTRAEVIETAAVVTITLLDDREALFQRFCRHAHREVFVPLEAALSCRQVIDGSYAHAPRAVDAA